jgi:hypothetical protein
MSSSTSQTSDRDPLKTLLEDTEDELRSRLHAACEAEAKGVSTETTADIRRLEDDLLAAAVAAKQTIAVRNHMQRTAHAEEPKRPVKSAVAPARPTQSDSQSSRKPTSTADQSERKVMGVREFSDDQGKPWRAWSVVPGLSKGSGGQFLGDFQTGWICFESLGTSARRRLPFPQSKWLSLTDEDLVRLLERAIDAPLREKKA